MKLAPFSGMAFWLFFMMVFLFYSVLHFFKPGGWVRNLFLIFFSAGLIASVHEDAARVHFLIYLFSFSAVIYWIGKLAQHSGDVGKRKIIIACGIVLIVQILVYVKYAFVQDTFLYIFGRSVELFRSTFGAVDRPIAILGISYFSFKFIHFLIDSFQNKIKNFDFLTFINYVFFFPSFFAGPINRYNSFEESIKNISIDWKLNTLEGIKRIINGLFKKTVAVLIFPHTVVAINFDAHDYTFLNLIVYIYAYMLYIYFDFSGYSDMAIGTGRLLGVQLPENFNYPFFKRNLQQFWASWHMSLSSWLTDYIYWPLVKKVRHFRWWANKPVLLSNLCIIVTFVICGIWHGDGLNFLVWGGYHGIGLAILNSYTQIEKKFSMDLRKFLNLSKVGYGVGLFVNINYVAFGFLLFGCNMKQLNQFFGMAKLSLIRLFS